MNCPVCDSASVSKHYTLHDRFFGVTPERFQSYLCRDCEALFLDQGLVCDRLAEFYPGNYWWSPQGISGRLETFYRHFVLKHDHLAFVKRALRGFPSPECLEIGCGSGTFTGMARREGLNIKGLEISAEAVAEARRMGIDCIEHGTVDAAVTSGKVYDAVIFFHLLEHLCEPRDFMKKVSGLVRAGGSLVLQVPNRSSWQARLLGSRWYGLDCPRHVCNYTLKTLEKLLSCHGFRIEDVDTFSLRDNAPAFVSSLFPRLDPLGSRVKSLAAGKSPGRLSTLLRNSVYFGMVLMMQPYAWIESLFARGGTVKIQAIRQPREDES